MLVDLKVPQFHPQMKAALIELVYCAEGELLVPGGKVLDLSVDLSAAFAQNCPPIAFYRMVLRENLWLRKLMVGRGDHAEAGEAVALFSTECDEPLDMPVARAARQMTAGIVYHEKMLSGGAG